MLRVSAIRQRLVLEESTVLECIRIEGALQNRLKMQFLFLTLFLICLFSSDDMVHEPLDKALEAALHHTV